MARKLGALPAARRPYSAAALIAVRHFRM